MVLVKGVASALGEFLRQVSLTEMYIVEKNIAHSDERFNADAAMGKTFPKYSLAILLLVKAHIPWSSEKSYTNPMGMNKHTMITQIVTMIIMIKFFVKNNLLLIGNSSTIAFWMDKKAVTAIEIL